MSAENLHNQENQNSSDKFRDSINTIDNSTGSRKWIYPKKPKGRFYEWRKIVSYFLLVFLFVTPFIKVHGRPFLLLNIFEREFILFSFAFGPYDNHIFVLIFIAFLVFIVLFTAIFGRVFCGWICPQTIFMEMVFRRIEYWIDGDYRQQKALKEAPMDGKKFFKRALKLFLFLIISSMVAHTFMAYLIGMDAVIKVVTHPPAEHMTGFIATVGFTGLFFFIFTWFREQACVIVCPYGRLQSVLLDQNSLIIAYDYHRGEPRGKLKKGEERTEGDCIDCKLCVDVCPTGIDIRNGLQLECVNCTACIDACDDVMVKINKPKGLIRYDSLKGIEEKSGYKLTTRVFLYTALLSLLLVLIVVLFVIRTDVEVNVLRTPGMLYQEVDSTHISNIYNFHLINKTFDKMPIELKLAGSKGRIEILDDSLYVNPNSVYEGKFRIIMDKKDVTKLNEVLYVEVYTSGKQSDLIKTSFLTHLRGVKR